MLWKGTARQLYCLFQHHENEHWEFDEEGLMRRRDMSANDYPIQELERRYR
nr:DUF1348 family protein [Ktedonobacter racemifer]